MIFYGWKTKSIPLGELGTQSCARCGIARPFRAFLKYSNFHLYWIFGVVTSRKYLAACSVCSQGVIVDKNQLQLAPTANEDPIPFMEKWGLGVFVAIIALVVSAVAMHR
ncbi:MAG: hypothetical protein ABSD67_17925 [Terracidiphilus sp.]|jgi:hypothetical protein